MTTVSTKIFETYKMKIQKLFFIQNKIAYKLLYCIAFLGIYLTFMSTTASADIIFYPQAEIKVVGFPSSSSANSENFFTVILTNKDAWNGKDSFNGKGTGVKLELYGGIFKSVEVIGCSNCFDSNGTTGKSTFEIDKDFLAKGSSAVAVIRYEATGKTGKISLTATGWIKEDDSYTDYNTIIVSGIIVNPIPVFSKKTLVESALRRGKFYSQSADILSTVLIDGKKMNAAIKDAWVSSLFDVLFIGVKVISLQTVRTPTTAQELFGEAYTIFFDDDYKITEYDLENTIRSTNNMVEMMMMDASYRMYISPLMDSLNDMKDATNEEAGYWESNPTNIAMLKYMFKYSPNIHNEADLIMDIHSKANSLAYYAKKRSQENGKEIDLFVLNLANSIMTFSGKDATYVQKCRLLLDDFDNFEDDKLNVDIIAPNSTLPALAGSYANPSHIDVTLKVKDGSTPITGLSNADFNIKIGEKSAEISLKQADTDGKYVFDIIPPTQVMEGKYNLEVTLSYGGLSYKDMEQKGVEYKSSSNSNSNVDVMLIMDRSGSMSEEITDAKASANLFINYMKDNDRVGVVSFGSDANYIYNLASLTPSSKNEIKNAINSISISGNTAMGRALRLGLEDIKNRGETTHPKAMVLLSDGQHNTGEHPDNVLPEIINEKIKVYTIGLGSSADENLLINIAKDSGAGGKNEGYFFAPSSIDLQKIYDSIVGIVTGQQTALSETGQILPSQTKSYEVPITSSTTSSDFSISWSGSDIDLTLYKPDGTKIDPDVATADPTIEYVEEATYEFYRVTNPDKGEWMMDITSVNVPNEGENFTAKVRVSSKLDLLLSNDKDQYVQGETVKTIVSLSENGTELTGLKVTTIITMPNNSTEIFILYDDGEHGDMAINDGVYANYFDNTLQTGEYKINILASGITPTGEQFSRISETSFEVIQGKSLIKLTPNTWMESASNSSWISTNHSVSSFSQTSQWISLTATSLQASNGNIINASNIMITPNTFEIPAQGSINFIVNIQIKPNAISGTYTGKIIAAANENNIISGRDSIDVTINVAGKGKEEPLTTHSSEQSSPSISGNRIVWKDKRNGNWDIYMYDISTSTEKQITTHSKDQLHAAISGDRIVWEDKRKGNSEIYTFDLSTGKEKRITKNREHQWYPDISGDRVVWQDKRNGNWDIYMYDLSTGTERQITTDPKYQTLPSISGDRIVWQDYRNGNWDIYMYDLSTSTERQITPNTADQTSPFIFENKVVWKDKRNGNLDIYMYDLSTDTEKQITTDAENQRNPVISGNSIFWQDHRNGNWDIYMYDLSTNTEKQITTDPKTQANPSISGNRIVWQDNRNGNWDIYMQDLSTSTERQITTNSASQRNPVISGNLIVWKDKRNGNLDIYLHDLSTSTEKQITTDSANQRNPAISGDLIVWEDKRNGNWDIYMYDLSASTEKRISTNSAHQWYPDISGDRIVWQDKRNGNWDIYMYVISASAEKQITTNPTFQKYPAISGNRIVWQDKRNGNWDIYIYDLSTNTEKQITTNTAGQKLPSISGDRIVWQDYRNGNWDIYMYDLSASTERQITTNNADQTSPFISGNKVVWKDKKNGNLDIYMYDLSTDNEKQITTDSANQRNPAISGDRIVWQDYRNGNWDIYMQDLSI